MHLLPLKSILIARHVSVALCLRAHAQKTPCTSSSSPFPESVFQHTERHCEDQRPQQSGALTQLQPLTGYESNRIAEDLGNRHNRHFTGNGQFTEHEDLRVRLLSFHGSIIASTCDSADRIATPKESDFDHEQLRDLLASQLYLQERGASAARSQVYHFERENMMSSSSQDPTSTVNLVAEFSSQGGLKRERERSFSQRHTPKS